MTDIERARRLWAESVPMHPGQREVDEARLREVLATFQRHATLERLFDAVDDAIACGTELPNAIAAAWQGAARTQERGS